MDLLLRLASDGSPDARAHTRHLRELNLVGRLLLIVKGSTNQGQTQLMEILWKFLGWLLHNNPRSMDLLLFGQFLAATLPVPLDDGATATDDTADVDEANRSQGLTLIHKLLLVSGDRGVNQLFADELVRVLGFDWLLLFAQPK